MFGKIYPITFLALAFNHLYAATDICSQLPGAWIGTTLIKNEQLCKATHGCTHFHMVQVTAKSDNQYMLEMYYSNFAKVLEQTMTVSCVDGIITMPLSYEYKIDSVCDSSNHCMLTFDTERFSAELIKK